MDPDVDRGDRQERFKARGNPLPADHQTAILLLEPGKGALGLKSWHHVFDRSASIFLRLPDALRELCPDTPLPELLPQRFDIIAFLRRNHFEALAWPAAFARVDLARIMQWHH